MGVGYLHRRTGGGRLSLSHWSRHFLRADEKKRRPMEGRRCSRLEFLPATLVCADSLLLADLAQAPGQQLLQLFQRLGESFDTFLELVAGHPVGCMHLVERSEEHTSELQSLR